MTAAASLSYEYNNRKSADSMFDELNDMWRQVEDALIKLRPIKPFWIDGELSDGSTLGMCKLSGAWRVISKKQDRLTPVVDCNFDIRCEAMDEASKLFRSLCEANFEANLQMADKMKKVRQSFSALRLQEFNEIVESALDK